MRKAIAILLMVLSCLIASATNYYVSNAGNDANSGTQVSPWASLSKVNSFMGTLVAGDSVLFQRGGTFFGTLTVSKAGVIIGAYGTGNLPVITGFKTLSGWTNTGANLWTASLGSPKSYMNVLTINGTMVREGRFPDWADNAGAWLTYTNSLPSSSPVTVNSSTTPPANFVGGELVLRKTSWNLDVMPITGQSGNSFTCNNPPGIYGITAGQGNFGFFIQNHPATLTVANEWYFNPSTNAVTIFSASSPVTTIRACVFDTLVNVTQTNVTIENLDIQGSNRFGVFANAGSFTLRNSIVRFVGYWGVQINGAGSNVINNTIRDIGSNGIWMANSGLIQGNQVRAISNIDGMGGNQDDQGLGIAIQTSAGVMCRNNIVDSISYNGIKFSGSNITIRENVVSNVCFNKNDGGAIYTWENNGQWTFTNKVVSRNVIINVGKILFGMPSSYSTGYYPLYMDGGTANVILDSNVVALSNVSQNSTFTASNIFDDHAILLNNPRNQQLTNTITFGFPTGLSINDWSPSIPVTPKPTGNNIQNNAFYVNAMPNGNNWKETNRSFFWQTHGTRSIPEQQTDIQNIGTMNNNIVADFAQSPFHWTSYSVDGQFPANLATWRTFSGKGLNSTSFPATAPEFQANTTASPRVYAFSGRQKRDFKGNIYNNQATIPPYYANIFFDNGPATGTTLAAFSSATQINCAGGTSTVTVSATGGVPPYTGTGTFTGVLAGTYTYTVTDAAANTITTTVNIPQPAALTANSTKTNVLCSGGSTGTITVVPIGGTPNYTFNWGGGVTTQNRTGLPIGTYTCTITDSRGCTTTTSQTINQPAPLSAGSPTAPPILVNGGSTTITQPLPTGGTTPYLYQLNTGTFQSSNIFNSVSAGNYTITIRDANNCTTASTISITQPTVFSATATAGTIACNGGSANVTVSASGGTPPYTGTGTFSRTAGTYVFTVTDAASATASANVTITQPTALAATISSTNVVCNGASTGTITLAPTGGTGAYTYLWNGGQTTQNRSALAAGTYSVVITDANGCTLTRSATVNQPTPLVITATPTPATIVCNGGSSSVVVGASGGTAPYTGIGTFQQSAGTTTYTINDGNSCPASTVVTLTQPAVLTAPNPTSGTITANGGTTSITQGAPTGGVPPYSYSLNTGAFQSSNVFTNVAAGTYTVNIRDANGCTITRSITVTQPAVFSASAVRTGPLINCNGQNTVVTVSASGGTAPYTGTGTFTVPAGSYNYTITDALGNTASASIVITQPTQVVPSIAAGSITSIGGTTNVVVSATGGTSPYTGVGTFTRNAGLYAFTVTDANGCSTIATISLNDPTLVPNQILILNSSFRNGN